MPDSPDAIASALDRAADAAEESAREQQQVAKVVRGAARARKQGELHVDDPELTDTVHLALGVLGRSAELLASAVGGLRRAWAESLSGNGLSIRQIGDRLGVSHQRVSALLTRQRATRGNQQLS